MMEPTAKKAPSTGQIIISAIENLHAEGQVITHDTIAAATGFKLTIVNDHVARLLDDGKIHRVARGVFAPALQAPPARPISATILTGGMVKLEIGDICLDLWPEEARALGALTAGQFARFSNIQDRTETQAMVTEMAMEMKKMRREIAALKQEPDPGQLSLGMA